jgi:hypothetical protein
MSHDKYQKLMDIMFNYILLETKNTDVYTLNFTEKIKLLKNIFQMNIHIIIIYLFYKDFFIFNQQPIV